MVGNEKLVNLCISVCKATGWGVEEENSGLLRKWSRNGVGEWYQDISAPMIFKGQTPVYTTDYLLAKLPQYFREGHIEMFYEEDEGSPPWCFGYHYGNKRVKISEVPLKYAQGHGYTPLEALLKLVLVMSEYGAAE